MKYLALGIFVLIVAWDILVYYNSRIRNRKKDDLTHDTDSADRTPPVFEIKNNYMPIRGSYDITISDFIEQGTLLQIHCSITQHGEPVRGFFTKDLLPFEQKIRSEIRMVFDRLDDHETDQTIKMWYSELDGTPYSDPGNIPLNVIITFFKPSHMDNKTKELLKQCLYPHLQDLVKIDWNEVNTILKNCDTKKQTLTAFLNQICHDTINADNPSISDSAKNICRHLWQDMMFFYANQPFYGGGSSQSVYEHLKAKYTEIEDCYLKSLSHEYAIDTVF